MKAEALIYEEDNNLVIGIRSEFKFDGAFYDGDYFVKYYTIEGESPADIETMKIVPFPQGWEIHIDNVFEGVVLKNTLCNGFNLTLVI
jgi:hypothetical protein